MNIIAKQVIFQANTEGYAVFRIPALVKAASGPLIAFCEGRKNSGADYGRIDIVLKRSSNNGKTWGKLHVKVSDGVNTCGNPCPIVDRDTGRICLVFCKNFAADREEQILSGEKLPRSIWRTFSDDEGVTWTEPEKISPQVRLENWTWYATGPCHGLQTKSGRYIVPCNHAELDNLPRNVTRSHVIFSDDQGVSWQIGGMCDWRTNESCVAETSEGLYINMRSNKFGAKRAFAFSKDDGLSFSECKYSEILSDPYCQGSVINYKNGILFCNAASEKKRENLTLRYSDDSCNKWKDLLVIEPGQSAYSDIALNDNGDVFILHECGRSAFYDCIALTTIRDK